MIAGLFSMIWSTCTQEGKMNKDAQMRATINQKLIETGERERLKELLRAKLIECGWKDQLKAHCKGSEHMQHILLLLFSPNNNPVRWVELREKERDWFKSPSWLSGKDVIKEKGLEHVTVDDLVAEITPKGRALVPDSVKKELLQRIRTFLAQHASL
uniref:Transcription and mRNA export factor ENY2 n=5 Tax=Sauria TaxID=32561 RepID=A0A8C5SVY8_LATLA